MALDKEDQINDEDQMDDDDVWISLLTIRKILYIDIHQICFMIGD